jgi:hypothetical protein
MKWFVISMRRYGIDDTDYNCPRRSREGGGGEGGDPHETNPRDRAACFNNADLQENHTTHPPYI